MARFLLVQAAIQPGTSLPYLVHDPHVPGEERYIGVKYVKPPEPEKGQAPTLGHKAATYVPAPTVVLQHKRIRNEAAAGTLVILGEEDVNFPHDAHARLLSAHEQRKAAAADAHLKHQVMVALQASDQFVAPTPPANTKDEDAVSAHAQAMAEHAKRLGEAHADVLKTGAVKLHTNGNGHLVWMRQVPKTDKAGAPVKDSAGKLVTEDMPSNFRVNLAQFLAERAKTAAKAATQAAVES